MEPESAAVTPIQGEMEPESAAILQSQLIQFHLGLLILMLVFQKYLVIIA